MPAETISIPTDPAFLDNLILQRTEEFIALGGGTALRQWFVTGERRQLSTFLTQENLVSAYLAKMLENVQDEVEQLCGLIGKSRIDSAVSIGPGNGIVELILCKRIQIKKLLLVDIENTGALHRHGFAAKGSGYASLAATKKFMASNGVAEDKLMLCNPLKSPMPDFPLDALFSFLSMGYHYPCDDYVGFIEANARPGAVIVLDKRKGSDDVGFDKLSGLFTLKKSIDTEKHRRVLLARP